MDGVSGAGFLFLALIALGAALFRKHIAVVTAIAALSVGFCAFYSASHGSNAVNEEITIQQAADASAATTLCAALPSPTLGASW